MARPRFSRRRTPRSSTPPPASSTTASERNHDGPAEVAAQAKEEEEAIVHRKRVSACGQASRPQAPSAQREGAHPPAISRLTVCTLSRSLRLIRWIDDQRRLDWWLSALVLVIAAGDAWASRHQIGPDGISYLDVATVVFAHGIKAGASIAWSPAYTWLVGAALDLVRPSRSQELIVVMAVNVLIVAAVLVAFAWWLRELFALLRHRHAQLVVSEPILRVLAYGVLAWAILSRVTSSVVEPDMLLGAVALRGDGAPHADRPTRRFAAGMDRAWAAARPRLSRQVRLRRTGARRLRRVRGADDRHRRSAGWERSRFRSAFACASRRRSSRCSRTRRGGRARRLRHAELRLGRRWGDAVSQLDGRQRRFRAAGASHPDRGLAVDVRLSGAGRGQHPGLVRPVVLVPGVRPRLVLGGQTRALASSVKTILRAIVVGPLILLAVPLVLLWWARRVRASPTRRTASRVARDRGRARCSARCPITRIWLGDRRHPHLRAASGGDPLRRRIHRDHRDHGVPARLRRAGAPEPQPHHRRSGRARDRAGGTRRRSCSRRGSPPSTSPASWPATTRPGTSDLRIARALTRAGIVAGDGVAFIGDTATAS